jgi:hypothetical protein
LGIAARALLIRPLAPNSSGGGPTSLVAAEIHLGHGQRASATAGRSATFKLRATLILQKFLMKSDSCRKLLELDGPKSLPIWGIQPKN